MTRSSRIGAFWESACVDYAAENGFPSAHRHAKHGTKDIGDLYLADLPLVVQCKAEKELRLGEATTAAAVQAVNAGVPWWAVWAKRRGKSSPAVAPVVVPGAFFLTLLRAWSWARVNGWKDEAG